MRCIAQMCHLNNYETPTTTMPLNTGVQRHSQEFATGEGATKRGLSKGRAPVEVWGVWGPEARDKC